MKMFSELGIRPEVIKALVDLGYETPTSIQEQSIPAMLTGKDLLAQAQTGTGKTAAFALPILTKLDLTRICPQTLVLVPTRELALQVAEAFQSYAKYLRGFHVVPIYGGQAYQPQLRALERGAHVIVGTPGRVMDHLRRGKLVLTELRTVILDEADEMLNMGFIEDIQWILDQIPHEHQTALFSATMPEAIKRMVKRYLKNGVQIKVQPSETSVKAIEQFCVLIAENHKLEALTRFLEIEDFNAVIIFTRTKVGSSELANKLEARGYSAEAINGDMPQSARERVITRLRSGKLDIIVATEVAARGLDVERIEYVINYDIPSDVESYIHRIGRTGRAGRQGKALLFVTPRERRMLRDIERFTKQKIRLINPPSLIEIKEKRVATFVKKITEVLLKNDIDYYREFVANLANQGEWSELDIAAALAYLAKQKEIKIELSEPDHLSTSSIKKEERSKKMRSKSARNKEPEAGMVRCRMELGYQDRLKPSDVVGLITNKCGIHRKHIGKIHIFDGYTVVDISENKVDQVIKILSKLKLKKRPTLLRKVE